MKRVYTIWPAGRDGLPATARSAWHQQSRWLVLDVSDGLGAPYVVEGPVSRATALRRELELRVADHAIAQKRRYEPTAHEGATQGE